MGKECTTEMENIFIVNVLCLNSLLPLSRDFEFRAWLLIFLTTISTKTVDHLLSVRKIRCDDINQALKAIHRFLKYNGTAVSEIYIAFK